MLMILWLKSPILPILIKYWVPLKGRTYTVRPLFSLSSLLYNPRMRFHRRTLPRWLIIFPIAPANSRGTGPHPRCESY